jgi:hypothetical protein
MNSRRKIPYLLQSEAGVRAGGRRSKDLGLVTGRGQGAVESLNRNKTVFRRQR